MPDDDFKNPLLVCAYGLAIAAVILAAGYALKWIIPACGAAFGIGTAIVSTGIIGAAYSSWVAPAASAGIVLGGISIGFLVMRKAVHEAKKNPYEWALPVLAIFSGFIIDSCKDLFPVNDKDNEDVVRVVYAASVAASFLIGGILWNQEAVKTRYFASKIAAALFFIMPPFLVYLRYAQVKNLSFAKAYRSLFIEPSHITWSIIGLLVMLVLTAVLSWACTKKESLSGA